MIPPFNIPATLAVATFLGFLLYTRYYKKGCSAPYPPGPKRLPLLGNILQFPSSFQWVTFDRWCKELNTDIIYLTAAGHGFLILNSIDVINDLYEKKSLIYSDRPTFPMTEDLLGWDWLFGLMRYGEAWKERRQLFTNYFHPAEPSVYQPQGMRYVRQMLPKLLETPESFLDIARHFVGASALSMAYGFPIKYKNDPYIKLAEHALKSISESALPGKFLVNLIPALKYVPEWVPGAGFQKVAKEWRKIQIDFREVPFAKTVEDMAKGRVTPSYTTNGLDNLQQYSEEEREYHLGLVKDNAGMVFEAAAETTLAAIQIFFASMLLFPDVQKKAQQELDRVLEGRLPEYSDESRTPYLSALVKEVLRWKPILPLGVPRSVSEDDIYNGYLIPKRTFIMTNNWSLLHDEAHYPDPDVFDPERFLENGTLRTDIRDPLDIIFGYSRRICPGQHIALSFLWLTAATILSVYDIKKPRDENGLEIEPHVEFHAYALLEPLPFKCTILPRSRDAEALIKSVAFGHDENP